MSRGLVHGLCTEFQIFKQDIGKQIYEPEKKEIENLKDDAIEKISKEFDFSLYIQGENKNVINWKLKKEIVKDEFYGLMKTYYGEYCEHAYDFEKEKILKKVKGGNLQEIIKLAKDNTLEDWRYIVKTL